MATKNNNPVEITVSRDSDNEMAYVSVDGEVVFFGSENDFHSGCQGSQIGGYELKGLWDQGIDSLAAALKVKMMEKGKAVVITKEDLTEEE